MKLSEFAGENGIFVDGDWVEKKDQDFNGSVRLIQLADVGAGHFLDKSNKHLTSSKAKELNCTYLHKGDILIARLGEPLCKACIFPYDGHYITAVDIAILRIGINEVNPNYLVYLINSPWFKEQIKPYESGTTRKRISRKNLDRIDINIPSIEIQNTIVKQIEESLSQLDSAVETLNKTKQQLEIYRQAVLKEAFDGNLTNSGKAKEDILKNYIEKPKYGTSKKCSYLADNTYKPVYRIPNINTKTARIDHTDIKYAHFDKKELETIRLQNNDLLIIRSNGSVSLVGRVALVTDDDTQGTFAGYLMRLRIINQQMLFPKYLLWYLQSKSAREYIESKAKSTSGVNNINSEEISNLTIPYYNFQSQKAIVEAIESRISIYDSIQQVVTTSLQQSEAMRQSILKQAFEGNDGKEL